MSADKVFFGLKNVHIASVTLTTTTAGTTATFGTPAAVPGDVSLTISPEGEEVSFYASDTKYYFDYLNNGYTGSMELARVPDSFLKDYLGMTQLTNKNIIEKTTDKANAFALLFEVEGDVRGQRYCFYYCKASRPTVEHKTTDSGLEVQTVTVEFVAGELPNGTHAVKAIAGDEATNYATWFSSVPAPTEP